LPSEPKIFHGRDSEVSSIIQMFASESPRIAILGTGGMGKTSLARAILHHPQVTGRYEQHRFFIPCDAASTCLQLAVNIGAHLGLLPGRNPTHTVIQYFSRSPPSLLILDNLETIWDSKEFRGELEGFLALLTDLKHLSLIITMRGAERPANIQWTRPFLEPLKPLTQDAARRIFIDIADDRHTLEDIDRLLLLADNMPLAIDLIANLVEHEGAQSVFSRWETERTSLLSVGHDKSSNLDLSISISLASSRIQSLPQSQDLLSLLSILPDGISDADLLQSKLPINNLRACKATLLRTSLAYTDKQGQLKALVPVREYVHKVNPPVPSLVAPLLKHFQTLLEIHEAYPGTLSTSPIVTRLTSNFANIQHILSNTLTTDNSDLVNAIYCTGYFDAFSRASGHGRVQLMHQIANFLPCPRNYRLEVDFITRFLAGFTYHPISNAQDLVDQALACFPHFDDTNVKCRLAFKCFVKYILTSHHQADFMSQLHTSIKPSLGISPELWTLPKLDYHCHPQLGTLIDSQNY
ncbi:P-loop containing nucleoside triphosphate hydrolase protein, partial [Mycena latifolia]